MKAYRNLDGCQMYEAGYVERVEFVPEIGAKDYCLVKFLVKPMQRKEDPINKTPFYKGWIVLDSVGPAIYSAFCACKGGADGGCRHTVAVLCDIAEYANDSLNPSVISGPCLWKKKERRSTDNPVPVNELSTSLPGSSRSEPPTTEYYDPCPGLLPDVNAFYEGLKVLQPNASKLLNRYKVDHTTPVKEDCTIPPLLDYMNRVIKEHPIISTISELFEFIIYSDSDITEV